MKKSDICLVIVFTILVATVILEPVSVHADYELQPAVVRKVVPDTHGFIGADHMTLVRFNDGYDWQVSGDRGEPGEEILVHRQVGTKSFFGVLADKGILFNKQK